MARHTAIHTVPGNTKLRIPFTALMYEIEAKMTYFLLWLVVHVCVWRDNIVAT